MRIPSYIFGFDRYIGIFSGSFDLPGSCFGRHFILVIYFLSFSESHWDCRIKGSCDCIFEFMQFIAGFFLRRDFLSFTLVILCLPGGVCYHFSHHCCLFQVTGTFWLGLECH